MNLENHQRLAALLRLPEGEIDLAQGALLLGRLQTPALEIAPWLARLDELGGELGERLDPSGSDLDHLDELVRFLFREQGFRGNRGEYQDPRNSFLHQVLRRRMGIPISLAVVAMEVGRRAGIPLEGIGFPGHFLLRHGRQRHLILDPFDGGEFLTPGELEDRLARTFRGNLPFHPRLLASVGPRAILRRMLANLKSAYLARRDLGKALEVLDLLLIVDPDDPVSLRDRGLLQVEGGEAERGAEDLERYLDIVPDADDQRVVRGYLDRARNDSPTVH